MDEETLSYNRHRSPLIFSSCHIGSINSVNVTDGYMLVMLKDKKIESSYFSDESLTIGSITALTFFS